MPYWWEQWGPSTTSLGSTSHIQGLTIENSYFQILNSRRIGLTPLTFPAPHAPTASKPHRVYTDAIFPARQQVLLISSH